MTDLTDEAVKALLDGATDGPWRSDDVAVRLEDKSLVALVYGNGRGSFSANNRLVAAAPDLTREQMTLELAIDFARNPRPHNTLAAPADSKEELREALTVLADALAEARAAQAGVVERAAEAVERLGVPDWGLNVEAIRALANPTGVALLAELRSERDEAYARGMAAGQHALAQIKGPLQVIDSPELHTLRAERDRLAAVNAALEAQVGARRAERDKLRAAVEGLIAVLDRNGEKGPIPDVEMMFCWLAAQNVRAAFRNTEGRGDMTDDEALETLFAMANVQDGYAKKATDRGLKIIHKANAKAQREVAATINDLRARLASAEAERDRLAAANVVLEAKVAGLVGAARPFADVADLFDSEVEGVGASDTLSLWLNGDNEEPAWRAMDFRLGDFGALAAALATLGTESADTPDADTAAIRHHERFGPLDEHGNPVDPRRRG